MPQPALRSICVYCGSNAGNRPEYVEAAVAFGGLLAERSITLVYGGGGYGMMGAVADGALDAGGNVIGIIPDFLVESEAAHTGVKDMRVVTSMLDRKAQMIELSDAFVALPGGIGTFDELFESGTWAQIGLIASPSAMLNVCGYFDPLQASIMAAVDAGFVSSNSPGLPLLENDAERLLDMLEQKLRAAG